MCSLDRRDNFAQHGIVFLQMLLDVLTSLSQLLALVREPSSAFVDDAFFAARSMTSPIAEIPCPNIMSNSASLNGGATLFFTTRTRVRLPTAISPLLDC